MDFQWDDFITRGLVFAMYGWTFFFALFVAKDITGNWTRRTTLVLIMMMSGMWAAYYGWITAGTIFGWLPTFPISVTLVLSRIGHYVTAAGLWTIVYFLRMVSREYAMVPVRGRER